MAAPRQRILSLALCFAFFSALLALTHFRLLDLPYFWDELGQFIPQTHDLATKSLLLPKSTTPNSHPPGLPLLLAALWKLTGISIVATRVFMLLLAAGYLTASFLLAIELLRGAAGFPAFLAIAMLFCCPLLYLQSISTNLDLPAALCTTIVMLAFTRRQHTVAVVAATMAVGFKETSLAIPLVLAAFAWRQGKRPFALALAIAPTALLLNYYAFVWFRTGHPFGDAAYTNFNLLYPLHPVRLLFAFLRRISWLALENLHVVPTAILAVQWHRAGFGPLWTPLAVAAIAHTVLVSLTGGAVLERYLLPSLPILYAAFAAGFSTLAARWRYSLFGITLFGLLGGLFWNPPWPYALENNLAMVDLVDIQRNAAGFAESRFADRRITTAWPLSDALVKPYLGYVHHPLPNVRKLPDFDLDQLKRLDWQSGDILILYSRSWQPENSLANIAPIRSLLRIFLNAPTEATRADLPDLLPLRPLIGYEQRGLWVEVLIVP
jgi:hypothetical protein